MSRILAATCVTKIVTAEGFPVPLATILSEGNGPSTGILIMQDGKAYYVTSNALDIKLSLTKLTTALNNVVAALTKLNTVPIPCAGAVTGSTYAGTATPTQIAASDIAAITAGIADITAFQELLR